MDTSDLEQTIWPRLGAIGERLWSPRDVADPDVGTFWGSRLCKSIIN